MSGTEPRGQYLVALVLAIGICTAMNCFTFAVLYDALVNGDEAGLSENATQVLTGWGGGVIGVIGAVVGYQVGRQSAVNDQQAAPPPASSTAGTMPGGGV